MWWLPLQIRLLSVVGETFSIKQWIALTTFNDLRSNEGTALHIGRFNTNYPAIKGLNIVTIGKLNPTLFKTFCRSIICSKDNFEKLCSDHIICKRGCPCFKMVKMLKYNFRRDSLIREIPTNYTKLASDQICAYRSTIKSAESIIY